MSRTIIHMRRLLLGISCVAMLGFGATQAMADVEEAEKARACSCQRTGYAYFLADDCPECASGAAWCDGRSLTPICVP